MPPKKDIIVNIQDEEHLLNYINSDNKKIVVVDIHPGWCGKCEMMFPTYKSLLTSIDDFEKRVDILMVDIEKIATYKNDKFRT